LLQLLWIVPLVIVVAGVALFDGPLTLARLLVIIISAALGGIAVLTVGWYSIGARPSNRK
jgi:hypothetical protein